MSRVISKSDRVCYQVDDLKVWISPLSLGEKAEVQEMLMAGVQGNNLNLILQGTALSLKYSVKKIEGLEDMKGNPYKLQFEDNKEVKLTDACIDDLLNIEQNQKLSAIAMKLVAGMPKGDFIDPATSRPLEGINIVEDSPRPLAQAPTAEPLKAQE